jgi:hypothetical protein
MIMESFPASNNRLEEIRREQASDPIIQELSRLCREGWTKKSKVRADLLSYWPMRAEFAVHDGPARFLLPNNEASGLWSVSM